MFYSDISVHHIPQRIHQLQEGISVRPITPYIKTLTYIFFSKLTRNIQLNDPKYINGGDIYEFSGFFVLHNSRQRKLTQLTYYIQIDQETKMSKVTNIGPIFPIHNFSPQNYKSLLRQCANVVGQIRMMQKTNPYQPEVNTEVTVGLLLNM
ncbi:hypothetical protein Bca4012_070170 [Brassica carinata]